MMMDDAPGKDGYQDAGAPLLHEVLRPRIPMGLYVGAPYAAALGICEALDEAGLAARIAWPHDVVVLASGDGRESQEDVLAEGAAPASARIRVGARGGYDDDGMFCELRAITEGALDLSAQEDAVLEAVRSRFASWEDAIGRKQGMAGPLAAFLDDYFDLVGLMGEQVDIRYPNGRLMGSGRFAGMDVWGRATIRLDGGKEIEIAPEQARICPHGTA